MTDNKALIAEARRTRGRGVDLARRLADALEAASVERAVVEAQALEQAAAKIALYRVRDKDEGAGAFLVAMKAATESARQWLLLEAEEIREGRP